jgi:stearoyl-CoA 9-desaturase NADPH oxidoreductase
MSLLTALANALSAPHGIDRYLEVLNPVWSTTAVRARIVQRIPETSDATTLVLQPNRLWSGHRAGQYVRVSVDIGGVRHTRCYSISSSQHRDDGCITITVKACGRVSNHLAFAAQPGDVLTLSLAEGDFVLPDERPSRLLFISGGSGVTPVMSVLRTLRDEGYTGDVTFLHYARTADAVIFGEEISRSGVRVIFMIDKVFAPEHLDAIEPCETFLCGPEPMMALVRPAVRGPLHEERFTGPALAPATNDAGGAIFFRNSNLKKPCDGRSLLEQAEAAGLHPEHGCRMGVCHGCTRTKYSGTVRDLRTGAISSAPDQDIQICVHAPIGDVTLDL